MNDTIQVIVTSLVAPLVLGGAAILWKFLDRKNEIRIKLLENKVNKQNSQTKKDIGNIYNTISILLANLHADRVYVIQPHPIGKNQYISIQYEVTDMGVMPVKERMSRYPVTNIPVFFGEISQRDFLYYKDISSMKGMRSRANFANLGTQSLIIKHLADDKNEWVGSLVADYLNFTEVNPDYARTEMSAAADRIQFILPPVDD